MLPRTLEYNSLDCHKEGGQNGAINTASKILMTTTSAFLLDHLLFFSTAPFLSTSDHKTPSHNSLPSHRFNFSHAPSRCSPHEQQSEQPSWLVSWGVLQSQIPRYAWVSHLTGVWCQVNRSYGSSTQLPKPQASPNHSNKPKLGTSKTHRARAGVR